MVVANLHFFFNRKSFSPKNTDYLSCPMKTMSDASFYAICTNETVNGIEFDWEEFPFDRIPDDIPIVADMSSNIGTNIIPWDKLGMVYAGAQKNLGTAGCTVLIIRDDLFGHAEPDIPILCDWTLHENSPDTYYNTPAIIKAPVTIIIVLCEMTTLIFAFSYQCFR